MGVGGYGKCPLQPFMTTSNMETISGIYFNHFWCDFSLYSKPFFMVTVQQMYLTFMVFQI